MVSAPNDDHTCPERKATNGGRVTGPLRSAAFSLLEMMLVIVLLGLLATVGLSQWRLQAQQALVVRAGDEMQQILQASMAYYVDHSRWPKALDDVDLQPYLPSSLSTENPWGKPYVLTHPNNIRLGLQTAVPTVPLANRVASRLPNAQHSVGSGGVLVSTEITVPGQESVAHNGLQVIRAGELLNLRDGDSRSINNLRCDGRLSIWPSIVAIRPKIENLTGGDPIARLVVDSGCREAACFIRIINQEEINLHTPRPNGTINVKFLVLCEHQLNH